MKKRKIVVSALCVILLFTFLLYILSLLLRPKYVNSMRDGAITGEYYLEADAGNLHDVIFLGDCEAYECIVPPILWNEFGIRSFVRGSPGQSIWQSYFLLCEIFKYEKPKVVFLNVYALRYGEPQREEYNRLTLDTMRNSYLKNQAIRQSMTKEENFISYYIPVLRYHGRWSELTRDDVKYIFNTPKVSHNGYIMQKGVMGVSMTEEEMRIEAYKQMYLPSIPEVCFDYVDKMQKLCTENGSELVLIKSPTNSPRYWWYDEWESEVCEYAIDRGITYRNFICDGDIGIDWQSDTYDGGVHLNVWGAEKFTRYLGEILSEDFLIASHKNNAQISEIWNKKYDEYISERDRE